MLTLAGGLDIFPLLTGQGEYQEFDRNGVAFAESIKQSTAADGNDSACADSQHADSF